MCNLPLRRGSAAEEPGPPSRRQVVMPNQSHLLRMLRNAFCWVAIAAVVIAIAGCSRIVGPRSFAMSAVRVDGTTWSVTINDTSGKVTNANVDPTPLFDDAAGSPFNPPASPDLLVIPWVGGACDRAATFNIVPLDGGGLAVSYRIEVAPGVCNDIGVVHQLVLTTSPAIVAGSVTVTRAP